MKIDFKKLKEQSWKKTLASFVIASTLLVFGLGILAVVFPLVYVIGCGLWEGYSAAPSVYHWTLGVLGVIGTWIWVFDWAEKQ